MQAYRQAIFKTVKPGDLVLDAGTGSGIMAMFACQAGARRVYAVELEDIIFIARRLAQENGFADRIVFLHKDVKKVQLDEKVDVIISELISENGPGENQAEIVNSCRDRLLKPHGKIVPLRVDMCIAPVEDVETFRMVQLPGKSAYGIDFSSCEQHLINQPIHSWSSQKALLAPGRTAYSYNAHRSSSTDRFESSLIFTVEREGTFHGYCSWFSSVLAEGIELSNKPPAQLCWSTIFFPLPQLVAVTPGMTIELNFRGKYDSTTHNRSDWDTTVRKGDQTIARHRQSCLLNEAARVLYLKSLSTANTAEKQHMSLSRYCTLHPDPEDRGLVTMFSTKTSSVVSVTTEVIRDIEQGNLPGKERKTLSTEGFLVKNSGDEEQEMLHYIDDLNAENTTFNAIVALNLDCNLACKYCFEGTRKGKHYLSAETAGHFIDFVKSKYLDGKDEISLVFYGGEPLLSTDMIVRISEEIGSLAKARGIEYNFALITNGTLLTAPVVERLKPLGLEGASITLDGPREVHDTFRPFKSGKGSFDTIVGNVRDVCRLIDVQIGGNYTRESYKEFPGLLDYLIESGLTPDRISFVNFDPVVNESKEFSPPDFHDGCRSINEPWLVDAAIFLREEILKRGFHTQEVAPSVCMIELSDDLVVNYDGTLYKCPGLIGRTEFCAGTVKTGLLDFRATHGVGNWKNEECLACKYLPLCFGGCRYMKLIHEGNVQGVDCKRKYFDKALQSLILQDVKYDNQS